MDTRIEEKMSMKLFLAELEVKKPKWYCEVLKNAANARKNQQKRDQREQAQQEHEGLGSRNQSIFWDEFEQEVQHGAAITNPNFQQHRIR